MPVVAWLWWIPGSVLGLGGLALIGWSLFGDRPRGRRRCRRCWYVLGPSGDRRCPECGHEARRERDLLRTRRHWRLAALGVLLAAGGGACFFGQRVHEEGWVKATPTLAYVALLPRLDAATFAELSKRVDGGRLRGWEYRLLVHRAVGVLERQAVEATSLAELAWLLGRIEVGGARREDLPWGSWALVSEIDRNGAIGALVGLLEHENAAVRQAAVGGMRPFRNQATTAMPALLGMYASKDSKVRHKALSVLIGLGLRPEGRLTFPVASAARPSTGFLAFCSRIGACRDDPACAVPILVEGLKDPDATVRELGIFGLAVLERREELEPRLEGLCRDDAPSVRRVAVASIPLVGLNVWLEERLRRALLDSSPEVPVAALEAIASLGPSGEGFRDDIREILEQPVGPTLRDGLLLVEAARAFTRIGGERREALDPLVRLLERADESTGYSTCQALDMIGRLDLGSPAARGAVEPFLVSDDPPIASAAAWAFVMSGGDRAVGTRHLIDAIRAETLSSGGAFVSEEFGLLLAKSGRIQVMALEALLRDDDPAIRASAVRCIGWCGRDAGTVLPRLRELVRDPDPNVARLAAESIKRIEWDVHHDRP